MRPYLHHFSFGLERKLLRLQTIRDKKEYPLSKISQSRKALLPSHFKVSNQDIYLSNFDAFHCLSWTWKFFFFV